MEEDAATGDAVMTGRRYVVEGRAKKGEKRCSVQLRTMAGPERCRRPAGANGRCHHHSQDFMADAGPGAPRHRVLP